MKLIVGLGNPEEKYCNTRHNIGYMSIDYYVSNNFLLDSGENKYNGYIYKKDDIILLKPYIGMNSSGLSVKECVEDNKIDLKDILIIHDDTSLDFGRIRIRESGSDGRHNGMKSIIESLCTNKISRIKVGIGKPSKNVILYNYVLGDFTKEERNRLNGEILNNVYNAVKLLIDTNNIQKVMNTFNK